MFWYYFDLIGELCAKKAGYNKYSFNNNMIIIFIAFLMCFETVYLMTTYFVFMEQCYE